MSGVALPSRPRLAEHAMVRRHFIDGEEVIVVHDARSGDLVRMPPRAWALIEAADGTRDIGGLLLAASQRGELRRASEVTAVLTDLQAAGLLSLVSTSSTLLLLPSVNGGRGDGGGGILLPSVNGGT